MKKGIYNFFCIIFSCFLAIFIFWNLGTGKNSKNEELYKMESLANSWNYDEVIDFYEKKWTWKLIDYEKLVLVSAYLDKWIYYYEWEKNWKKAIDILEKMDDSYEVLYYKWFVYEMTKDYVKALEFYHKALNVKNIDNSQKSVLYNQIWHVHDLRWDLDKILPNYQKAHELDNKNIDAIINLWRYYLSMNDIEKWYKYFNDALALERYWPKKSEIYFSLSWLELELNWLTPDIDKSVEYAKKWIEFYPVYAMNYVALANAYYMKNNSSYHEEIQRNLEKSIEMNPNWTYSYEILSLLEYEKWNFTWAVQTMRQVLNVSSDDYILMNKQKEETISQVFFYWLMYRTLRDAWDDQEKILNFIKENWWLANHIILKQIKRKDYWIFYLLKNNKEFEEIVKSYQ